MTVGNTPKKTKKKTSTTCAVLARGPKQRRETKMLAEQKQFVPCWCLEWCVLLQSDLTHNAATYDSMLISYAYMHIWEREMMIQCHLFFHCGKLHPRLFLNDELLNNWWSITSTQIWTETMETNGINNMLQLEQRGIKEEKKKISCAFSDDSFHTSNMFYVQTQLGLGENTGKL